KAELDWDTTALPEGKYRVRVEASDELANPPDQSLKHELVSETVLVDNTPPRIDNLTLNGRKLRCRVVDGTSPIARVEKAVDAEVGAVVPPGSHVVVVRAFDTAGNSVARDVEAR